MRRHRSRPIPSLSTISASCRCPLQRVGKLACDRFHHLLALAQIPRRPVELPEAVQDGSLDAVLRIAVEDHSFVRIVFAGRVKQAEHAGMNQVIEVHMHWKTFMHSHRDGLHQRKVVENDPVPDGIRDFSTFCRYTLDAHIDGFYWHFFRLGFDRF